MARRSSPCSPPPLPFFTAVSLPKFCLLPFGTHRRAALLATIFRRFTRSKVETARFIVMRAYCRFSLLVHWLVGSKSLDGWANLYSSKFRQFWLAILGPLFEELPEERRIFGTEERPPQDHFIFLGTGTFLPSDPKGGMDVDRRFNMNLLSLMNVGYLLSYYPISSKYLVEIHAPVRPLERTNWDYATGRVVGLAEPGGGWPSIVRRITVCRQRPSECRGSGLCLSQCVHLAASIFRCAARAT